MFVDYFCFVISTFKLAVNFLAIEYLKTKSSYFYILILSSSCHVASTDFSDHHFLVGVVGFRSLVEEESNLLDASQPA